MQIEATCDTLAKYYKLKNGWQSFKHNRAENEYLSFDDPCYITVKQREKIIDFLFDLIGEIEYE